MASVPFQVTLLIGSVGAFIFSALLFRNGKSSWSIALLILGGLLLRIYVSLDPYLHEWDERFHALVAKNLLQHPLMPTLYDNPILLTDDSWGLAHIWLHKPPLTLWIISLSLKFFGANAFAVRIPSILLSTIGIFLIWSVAKNLFDRRIGWLAAFLFAINGSALDLTGGRIPTDHPDLFFFFFILLAVYFAVMQRTTGKWWFIIPLAISLAAAIYCKWLVALIVLPVWMSINPGAWPFKKILRQAILIILVIVGLVLPWQIYIFKAFPQQAAFENHWNNLHLSTALENHSGTWYMYLQQAMINWNEATWIAFIIFFWFAFKMKFRFPYAAILIWIVVPYIFFSSIETKMPQYVFFCAPAIFIVISFFWLKCYDVTMQNIRWRIPLLTICAAIIVFAVRFSILQIKPLQFDQQKTTTTEQIKALKTIYNSDNTIFFNTASYIDIMFYTSFVAYPFPPTEQQINELIAKGYQIVVCDGNHLPDEIRNNDRVKIIMLPQ